MLLDELMLADRPPSLDALLGVVERFLVSGACDAGERSRHRRVGKGESPFDFELVALALGQHPFARNPYIVEINFTLIERALAELVERLALGHSRQVERDES